MRNKKNLLHFIIIGLFTTLWTGCDKDYNYVQPEVVVVTSISFSKDIQPIFNANCTTSGCHDGQNIDPDLTAGNSYNALFNMGDVNTTTPDSSKIYLYINYPNTNSKHMPGGKGGPSLTNTQIADILAWIQQGAKNN